MSIESLLTTPVGTYLLDELVAQGPGRLPAFTESGLYAFVARAASESSAAKFRVPPVRAFPWDAVLTATEAEALSDAIVDSPAAAWWSSRALDRAQLWIGPQDATPQPGHPSPRLSDKPPSEIWTSSALDDGTSAWWPLLREGPDGPPPTESQSVWQLTPSPNARVYEITSAEDYARLRDQLGDWDAIAQRYDGVHLSVAGLIRAQGVTCGSVMLDDWDVESTAWLRWCFDAVERVGEVEPLGGYTFEPVRHTPIRRALAALRARRRS